VDHLTTEVTMYREIDLRIRQAHAASMELGA
jgi:hypothetical protein